MRVRVWIDTWGDADADPDGENPDVDPDPDAGSGVGIRVEVDAVEFGWRGVRVSKGTSTSAGVLGGECENS